MTVRAGSSQEARRVVETALQSAAEDGAISGWEINLEPMNAPEGEWKFGALVFVAADSTDEADKRVQATLDGLVTEDMLDGWWTIGPAALWMPGWSDEGR
jgi:hypothetical protein